MVKLVQVKVL